MTDQPPTTVYYYPPRKKQFPLNLFGLFGQEFLCLWRKSLTYVPGTSRQVCDAAIFSHGCSGERTSA